MKKSLAFLLAMTLVIPIANVRANSISLAETLDAWLNDVTVYGNDVLSTHYGIIFGKLNVSAYDDLAERLLEAKDWTNIILLKRVCELSRYNSKQLNNSLFQALVNMPMLEPARAIPVSCELVPGAPAFLVYHRHLIHAYRYAESFGLTDKWNKTLAFEEFARCLNNSRNLRRWLNWSEGGFLAITENSVLPVPGSRYFDEEAEDLEIFSLFADMEVPGAEECALFIWNDLNRQERGWFNETFGCYWYTPDHWWWECEIGAFALTISRYLARTCYQGPFKDRILSDINCKLLHNGWNSGCWLDNIIIHAYDPINNSHNFEMRPSETNTAWHALHSLYPCMSSDMKANMTAMLMSPAWELSIKNSCFNESNVARLNGAMVMFLTGIVPETGSLDLGFIEEGYSENLAAYGSWSLQFDYANRRIRIPVKQGELKFLFGTKPTNWTFEKNWTYDVFFGDDWNSIKNATLVYDADLNDDWIVDTLDAILFDSCLDSNAEVADINADGIVDLYDAILLANRYGRAL